MTSLAIASIAYNAPDAVDHQLRLLSKHLTDDHHVCVFDGSSDEEAAARIGQLAYEHGAAHMRLLTRTHHEALNQAAKRLLAGGDADIVGFLDHDVFPVRQTTVVDKVDGVGFYGVGQRHPATGVLYPWPGFVWFSRDWVAGRELDFGGILSADPRYNGDTGSLLWPLFREEDWQNLFRAEHGYRALREPDDHGLQSWGYEVIGDWIHLSNASHWMAVPDPEERDRLAYEMLAAL